MDRYNANIKFMKVDMESKHNSTWDTIEGILNKQLSSPGGISNSQLDLKYENIFPSNEMKYAMTRIYKTVLCLCSARSPEHSIKGREESSKNHKERSLKSQQELSANLIQANTVNTSTVRESELWL